MTCYSSTFHPLVGHLLKIPASLNYYSWQIMIFYFHFLLHLSINFHCCKALSFPSICTFIHPASHPSVYPSIYLNRGAYINFKGRKCNKHEEKQSPTPTEQEQIWFSHTCDGVLLLKVSKFLTMPVLDALSPC